MIKGHDNFRKDFPLLAAVDRCANREFVTFTVHEVGDTGEGGVVFPLLRGGAAPGQAHHPDLCSGRSSAEDSIFGWKGWLSW